MAVGDSSTQVLTSMHKDYVHHLAFDVYGRRMATCSGDRFVRVWDLNADGGWTLVGEWQAHRGSVEKLSWAHPEFGSLLATCGSDHEARIWEERSSATVAGPASWTAKAQLTESRRPVSCLEFAPRHLGLKLATGSADGSVRIYDAVDVMNLSHWPMTTTFQCFGEGPGVSSLSWSTGRFEPPTIVVGGPSLAVYRFSESTKKWASSFVLPPVSKTGILDVAWAPNIGRRFHYIASAEGQALRVIKVSRDNDTLDVVSTQTLSVVNCWRCEFNVTGTVLAASCDKGVVQLFKSDYEGSFKCVSKVQGGLPVSA